MRHAIALAALALLAVPAVPAPARAQGDYHGCPAQGDAAAPVARALNDLKNRARAPLPAQLDPPATPFAALLVPGDDTGRWSAQRGAVLVGYVHDVKPGGIETANCRARGLPSHDTHIELVLDPLHADASRQVVVEVTPRWRATAWEVHPISALEVVPRPR